MQPRAILKAENIWRMARAGCAPPLKKQREAEAMSANGGTGKNRRGGNGAGVSFARGMTLAETGERNASPCLPSNSDAYFNILPGAI